MALWSRVISGVIAAVSSGLPGRWFRPKNPPDDRDEVARELDELFGPYDFYYSGLAQHPELPPPPPPPQAPPPTVEELVAENFQMGMPAAELQSVVRGLMLIAGAVPNSPVSVTETGEEERQV